MSSKVSEQIRLLRELQVVDTQIREIERAKSDLPRRREDLQKARARDRADIEAAKQQLTRNDAERQRLEKEITWDREALAAFEDRTKNLTHADAITAQARELETRRKSIKEKEDQVLKIAEEREVLQKKVQQLEADFSGVETKYAEEDKELAKQNAEVDEKTAGLRAQRTEMAKGVDKSLVSRYEQIFTRREGRAVVPVKGEVCQGCDMGVPPQIVNFTRSGEQGIQTCPHCSRILYWEPSEAPAEKPKKTRGRKKKGEPAADDADDGSAVEKHE